MKKAIPGRVDFSGPFFEHDPRKTFRQNVRVLLEQLAAMGEEDVKAQMRAAGKPRYGRTVEHVRGRVKNLSGKKWALTAVVSIPNVAPTRAEAIKLQAIAHGRLIQGGSRGGPYRGPESRHRAFRNTTFRIRAERARMASDLAKGLT